jgi:hypothetical protein
MAEEIVFLLKFYVENVAIIDQVMTKQYKQLFNDR